MKILIVEDEKIASDKLERMLKEVDPGIEVAGKTGSIKSTVQWLIQHTADLIFLDIQLSDGISFSIFDQVEVDTPIIFTTAYDQYAIKAFQLNSIAYLLKPVRKNDLIESLAKHKKLQSAYSIDFEQVLSAIQGKPAYKERFLVQVGEKIRTVEASEAAYFYVLNKGVYIRTFEGKSYPLDYTLERLDQLLNPSVFFRVNRKYLIQLDAIINMFAYSRGRVKLELKPKPEDEDPIIVSIERSADFKNWLNR